MTTRDLQHSIEPDSTEYGDRAQLEEGLSVLGAQQSSAPPAVTAGGSAPSATPPSETLGDPMALLLSDELSPSDRPVTHGLSFGPGAGRAPQFGEGPNPEIERLRAVAQFARTPQLRAAARRLLRRKLNGR